MAVVGCMGRRLDFVRIVWGGDSRRVLLEQEFGRYDEFGVLGDILYDSLYVSMESARVEYYVEVKDYVAESPGLFRVEGEEEDYRDDYDYEEEEEDEHWWEEEDEDEHWWEEDESITLGVSLFEIELIRRKRCEW